MAQNYHSSITSDFFGVNLFVGAAGTPRRGKPVADQTKRFLLVLN